MADPLLTPLDVTTAVKLPPTLGLVVKVTVRLVAVAAVTIPTALWLKTTVFLRAVVSNPNPLMVIVVAFAACPVVATVTDGVTVATWTALPLDSLLVVTTAVKEPAVVGLVPRVTVKVVAVAVVTVPTAPLSKVTVLSAAVVLKPKPLMVIVEALADRLEILLVTTGFTVATCTAVPLALLLVVTMAVRLPVAVGLVEKVTMSEVAVAVVTVPTAPLLKTTVLFAAVVSNPNPLMVIVDALAACASVLEVTTGMTLAI